MFRSDLTTMKGEFIQPQKTSKEEKLRWNWNTPIVTGAKNPKNLYVGAQYLYKSTDQGRNWKRISVGNQKAGDVGVTYDRDTERAGADHVYLVVERIDSDKMIIADNQAPSPHSRYASGRGRTATEYFLRAPDGAMREMRSMADAGGSEREVIDPNNPDFFPWDDEDTNDLQEPFGDEGTPPADGAAPMREAAPAAGGDDIEKIAERVAEILLRKMMKKKLVGK